MLIVILALLVVGYFLYRANKASFLPSVAGQQYYYFDHQQFSTQEFYSLVEKAVKDRQIPDVSVSRVNFHQAGILSAKREYLRVARKNQTFDICAAPFGTGFFVSYWLGVQEKFADKIPMIARMKENKTYYQWDTENMYKSAVKAAINEAIDNISPTAKGARALSDLQIGAEGMIKK
jgi:hypothetical protein